MTSLNCNHLGQDRVWPTCGRHPLPLPPTCCICTYAAFMPRVSFRDGLYRYTLENFFCSQKPFRQLRNPHAKLYNARFQVVFAGTLLAEFTLAALRLNAIVAEGKYINCERSGDRRRFIDLMLIRRRNLIAAARRDAAPPAAIQSRFIIARASISPACSVTLILSHERQRAN